MFNVLTCGNRRIQNHFTLLFAVWGEKTFSSFVWGTNLPRRVCPMKTDRCYLDTLPVSTSTPPSRAPVCSVISVYVCIYQQKWDEKDTTIMIKAILVFNNHGKPRLSKFYQYFVSDSVMCCCQLSWVVRWWGSFIQKSNKFEYRIF